MKCLYTCLISITCLLMFNCSNSPTTVQEQKVDITFAQSDVQRDTQPASNEQLSSQVTSNNKFALALYKELVEDGLNCFFSPYSITMALSMTAAGAEGTSLEQIKEALKITLPGVEFDQALNSIDQSILSYTDNSDHITFKSINTTWMQTGSNFRIGFLDHLSRYYGAGVNMVDFSNYPDECRTSINDWIGENTNDKILNLLPDGSITEDTKLVLTNAVYFSADWQYSFLQKYTIENTFNLADGSRKSTPTMHYSKNPNDKVTMRYTRKNRVRALDFPYKDKQFTMTVLLPDKDSFPVFEQSLTVELLNTIIASLQEEELPVSLPKFSFTYGTKDLKKALNALGIVDPFIKEKANFSRMDGTNQLHIGQVLHKAFIAVDEEGTEAAAATAVGMVATSNDPDKVEFFVNRPFIYFIRDTETNTILFMGRILDPLQSN